MAPMPMKLSPEATAALAALCQSSSVQSLALFGSQLHGNAHSGSDIDLLVRFLPGQQITLLDMARLEIALTDLLGCKADLRTANELSPYFRQTVLAEAHPLYFQEVL